MMKNVLALFLTVALGSGIFLAGGVQTTSAAGDWDGVWYSASGDSTIFVVEKDGFVDITGKDSGSDYSCTGLIEKNVEGGFVECSGTGKNVNGRFVYKSKLKMIEKGQIVEEKWEAKFADGKKITGDSTFRRKKSESR